MRLNGAMEVKPLKILTCNCAQRWAIKAARPQYEARMLLKLQMMIRSTNVQLQKRVAFNSMLPECVGIVREPVSFSKNFFEGGIEFLNLYSGVGGNVELLPNEVSVTNIELNPKIAAITQKRKPQHNTLIEDAHEYLKNHYSKYNFVWSSRPCQSHTRMMKFTRHKVADYPDMSLYAEIIFLKHFFKGLWVVENVKPYYEPLIKPTIEIGRHLFWSNFEITPMEHSTPKGFINLCNMEGKRKMMDWLGIHFEENVYYNGNHDPAQVLRNCVHPEIGLHVFNCAVAKKVFRK